MQAIERSDGADWDWPNAPPAEPVSDPEASAEPQARQR